MFKRYGRGWLLKMKHPQQATGEQIDRFASMPGSIEIVMRVAVREYKDKLKKELDIFYRDRARVSKEAIKRLIDNT